MGMKRLFTAVDIPDAIAEELADLQNEIRGQLQAGMRVSWVPASDIHLTLKFLGSVEADIVDKLGDLMRDVATTETPFQMQVRNVGAFPAPNNPRILWVGADPESGTVLKRLHDRLEQRFHHDYDIDFDEHSFKPHFTLGRVKSSRAPNLVEIKPNLPDGPFGTCKVKQISMYESELTHEGAEYTEIRRAPLSG